MCGIVGFIGNRQAKDVLIEGLARLEYRGYDSAGIAVLNKGEIEIYRSKGKLSVLKELISDKKIDSKIGIGHTRWATHGKPSDENAHPHKSKRIALVHNGIIENYLQLKNELIDKGYEFSSETDTEVIAHLIDSLYKDNLFEAVKNAIKKLKGSYAIAVISENEPDKIVVARYDSPLVIGVGENEMFTASDIPAVLSYTRKFIFLEEGDVATLTKNSVYIENNGKEVKREIKVIDWNPVMAEKAGYKHFMLKEIYEQPRAIIDTIRGKYSLEEGEIYFGEVDYETIKDIEKITIVACGTSWHAGLVGKFYIENFAKIPVEVDIASEFRYRNPIATNKTLLIPISQSGETADTIAALRMSKKMGAKVVSICNVVGSTIARESDGVIYTHAGPEIGVASTKAFTTQLASLFLFALFLGQKKGVLEKSEIKSILNDLIQLPEKIEEVLKHDKQIEDIAKEFVRYKNFLYLGRHYNYPIALEGALKLKEISYIHAEGYPAGEMKHGPIALIDKEMPVFVLGTKSRVYDKILANVEEVKARDGIVISTVTKGDKDIISKSDYSFILPVTLEELTPFLNSIIIQLFAYHASNLLGLDVDQPRNLAKSVTVE
ncbi:glucosamine--fructose-6-phosphate aminotransferase [Deferribacter desulfuricans SSM1]|uniref:Glutamine--fructose-6-phosphate aminotransferase [isomerizing] n=1 Tax=Deferribacter desulfuricans (strain DSM 14783 / JCM 11476 / NBRC 101012 / SSM1) TaxID=639282 RepID=D3P9K8_DEFDS|nr:glutamine--fructose-6-phosphate transaminase (isomerizing) [Deferribacter desulfuricans]BAI81398.1 glucosamine--fructose-6-phosphate aminotransferase [Deferribacter desulfuricans SSM1]